MIVFIYDIAEDKAVGAIETETSTARQIQEIIDAVKNQLPDEYTWDDIEDKLPEDCQVYWLDENSTVGW